MSVHSYCCLPQLAFLLFTYSVGVREAWVPSPAISLTPGTKHKITEPYVGPYNDIGRGSVVVVLCGVVNKIYGLALNAFWKSALHLYSINMHDSNKNLQVIYRYIFIARCNTKHE